MKRILRIGAYWVAIFDGHPVWRHGMEEYGWIVDDEYWRYIVYKISGWALLSAQSSTDPSATMRSPNNFIIGMVTSVNTMNISDDNVDI